MLLNILRADPAGNITIFVLDEVAAELRAEISSKLMAIESLGAEQVGFITKPVDPSCDCRLEMMGGEFCGNASRSLALYLAREKGESGSFKIEVSGLDAPITVSADLENSLAFAEMPLPKSISSFVLSGFDCLCIDCGGITHLVSDCAEPNRRLVNAANALFGDDDSVSAYGVIFLDEKAPSIIPAVYVKATDSLVWEGSCGSGSVAAAVSLAMATPDGEQEYLIAQPKGELTVRLKKQRGRILSVEMGGKAKLDDMTAVEI